MGIVLHSKKWETFSFRSFSVGCLFFTIAVRLSQMECSVMVFYDGMTQSAISDVPYVSILLFSLILKRIRKRVSAYVNCPLVDIQLIYFLSYSFQ